MYESYHTRKSIRIWEKVQYCCKRKARRPMVSWTGHRCFGTHAPPTSSLLFIVWRFRVKPLYSLSENGKNLSKFCNAVDTVSDVIMLIWYQFDKKYGIYKFFCFSLVLFKFWVAFVFPIRISSLEIVSFLTNLFVTLESSKLGWNWPNWLKTYPRWPKILLWDY